MTKKDVLAHGVWINPEDIRISEIRQSPKDKFGVIPPWTCQRELRLMGTEGVTVATGGKKDTGSHCLVHIKSQSGDR